MLNISAANTTCSTSSSQCLLDSGDHLMKMCRVFINSERMRESDDLHSPQPHNREASHYRDMVCANI